MICNTCPSSHLIRSRSTQRRKTLPGPYGLLKHNSEPMSSLLPLSSRLLAFRKGLEPSLVSRVLEHLLPVAHHPVRTQRPQPLELFDSRKGTGVLAIVPVFVLTIPTQDAVLDDIARYDDLDDLHPLAADQRAHQILHDPRAGTVLVQGGAGILGADLADVLLSFGADGP